MFGLFGSKSNSEVIVGFPTKMVAKNDWQVSSHTLQRKKGRGKVNVETAIHANYPFPLSANVVPYFEVSIDALAQGNAVAVGLCGTTSFPETHQFPGWPKDSCGVHSDDGLLYVDNEGVQLSSEMRPFGPGDVVGLGTANGFCFVTFNGVLTGFAPSNDENLAVIAADGAAELRTNLGSSPFAADVFAIVARLPPRRPSFSNLPVDVLVSIGMFVGSLKGLQSMKLTSSSWNAALSGKGANPLWSFVAVQLWPHLLTGTGVPLFKHKNWHNFVKKRRVAQLYNNGGLGHAIEACMADQFDYACPVALEKMKKLSEREYFCGTCKESVHVVTTKEELYSRTKQKQCVSFEYHRSDQVMDPSQRQRMKNVRGKFRVDYVREFECGRVLPLDNDY